MAWMSLAHLPISSVEGDQEQYSFVIPVVRALLERVALPLRTWNLLPSLPSTDSGPAFFDQFQKYALNTAEWSSFISNAVSCLFFHSPYVQM